MCGISGFNFKDENLIQEMNGVLAHRGPDGGGVFLDEDISLGHRRLSIIDLSERANQPMKDADGKLIITYNGEIYNFREIRKELSGYPFKTGSDTEVILAAYKKWGYECVKRFNGIFAFAVWDKNKQELFFCRDRGGVKPLYYYKDADKFIFASEIKAILKHNIKKEISKEAFAHYFCLRYVPQPLTIFKNIFKLPSASFAVFKNGNLEIKKYWDIESGTLLKDKREIKREIVKTLDSAVESQLISDRPLGVFLSGGIDSSAVLYFASKHLDSRVKTFSVGFDISGENEKFNADFNIARKTAKFFGADHHEFVVSGKDILDNLEKAAYHMDEPVSNATQTTTMLLSKFASSEVAVVLGGDGGDEIFGGYDRYRLSRLVSEFQSLPKIFRIALAPAAGLFKKNIQEKLKIESGAERYFTLMSEKEDELNKVVNSEFLRNGLTQSFFKGNYFSDKTNQNDFENLFMLVDFKTWLQDESLMRTDKMSMAFGLEERVPFLDHRLIELGFKIPSKFKVSLFETKIILKDALKSRLPGYLFNQPKRGWFTPMAKWLRSDLRDFSYSVLSPDYCPATQEFFDFKAIREIFDAHIEKRKYNLNLIWSLIVFQLWYKRFMC